MKLTVSLLRMITGISVIICALSVSAFTPTARCADYNGYPPDIKRIKERESLSWRCITRM